MSKIHVAAVAALFIASAASAQQPNASAGAFSMAGNYQAAATGADAVAWNPAMLGMGNGGFSLNLLSGGILSGLAPVKLTDITNFGKNTIPVATKEVWLNQIGTGMETGGANAGFSLVALSVGPVALQAGLSGSGDANLNQDATEVLLYGNAGRTGAARDMSFSGSNMHGSSFATGAASIGLPLPLSLMGPLDKLSMGLTVKYVRGLAVVLAQDGGSTVTSSNVVVAFPAIYTDSTHVGNSGSGVGVDLGLAWNSGGTTIGATVRNVTNTFKWSTTSLNSTPGTVTFDGTNNNRNNFDAAPYAAAPAAMRAALEDEKFKPELAAGIAHRGGSYTLTADASSRADGGIDIGPKTHLGVGAEYRAIPMVSLRAGAAAITDGAQAAAGVGLKLGPTEVGFGMSVRSAKNNTQYGAMVSLLSIH